MGSNCIDVVRLLIDVNSLQSCDFTLIEHSVGINWRVTNSTTRTKIANIEEGLIQHKPIQELIVPAREIVNECFNPCNLLNDKENVISISSKIKMDKTTYHLPMMNIHTEPDVNYTDMLKVLRAVTGNMPGYVLKSGRYFHFYGNCLLSIEQWHKFIAQFLMPTLIVSPRYIGHCLYRGYAALRITTNKEFKPRCPDLCDEV